MNSHPRPAPDAPGHEFWQAAARGVLALQRCGACGAWRHPPAPRCASCHSADASFEPVSGRGELHTWTEVHPPVLPAFVDETPYVAIVVALEEGPLLVSRLTDHDDVEVRIGLPVEVTFHQVDHQTGRSSPPPAPTLLDDLTVPWFRPREA